MLVAALETATVAAAAAAAAELAVRHESKMMNHPLVPVMENGLISTRCPYLCADDAREWLL